MASTYENVPVFKNTLDYEVDNLVGRAQVEIGENGKTLITIEAGEGFTEWLKLGNLQALALGAAINQVDSEAAREYWSQRQ